MKKVKYNIHEAINLRGLTIRKAGFADPECCHPRHWDEVIDFRMSMQMSDMSNGYYPDLPLVYDVLGAGPEIKKTNKGQWRKAYGAWRKYQKECYQKPKEL